MVNRSGLLSKLINKDRTDEKFLSVTQSICKTPHHLWNGMAILVGFFLIYRLLPDRVLSPTFFNKFLEDLPDYLSSEKGVYISHTKILYILFANDLVLMSENSPGIHKSMQKFTTHNGT